MRTRLKSIERRLSQDDAAPRWKEGMIPNFKKTIAACLGWDVSGIPDEIPGTIPANPAAERIIESGKFRDKLKSRLFRVSGE